MEWNKTAELMLNNGLSARFTIDKSGITLEIADACILLDRDSAAELGAALVNAATERV